MFSLIKNKSALINPYFLSALLVLIYSIIFGLKQILLAKGNVIAHFPGIGYDGLDWYTEGAYFINWLFASPPLPLPMLRPPIFVLICALDNVLGHAGYVLGIINGLCIFFTYIFIFKIIQLLKGIKQSSNWYAVPLAVGVMLHPLNYFKTYISYSDNLASTLSIIGFYFFIRYWKSSERSYRHLAIAFMIFLIASLTQTYGLIPYFIAAFLYLLQNRKDLKSASIPIVSSLTCLVIYLVVKLIWASLLPHETTAYNFGLLRLSLNMLPFYLNAWPIFFFSLPFILVSCVQKNALVIFKAPEILCLPLIALAILVLAFFYQMPEARYTSFAWPWILASIILVLKIDRRSIGIASFLIFLPFVAVPANYWIPTLRSVRVIESYHWNWLFDYWNLKSVNFNLSACEIECGDEWMSKYAKTYNAFNAVIEKKYGHSLVGD